jgi:hypothetical protein
MSIPDQTGHSCQIYTITNEHDLAVMCQLPKAIVYIGVDWSQQERQSRQVIQEALKAIDMQHMPVFSIDCSNQQLDFFENWLIVQTQHVHLFYTGGYGETLLVQHGQVTDFINYPGKTGLEQTVVKIKSWL